MRIKKVASMLLVVCLFMGVIVVGPAQAATPTQTALEQALAERFKWMLAAGRADTTVTECTNIKELPEGYTLAGYLLILYHSYIDNKWRDRFIYAPMVLDSDSKAYVLIPLPYTSKDGRAVQKTPSPVWWHDKWPTMQVKMEHKNNPDALVTLAAAVVPMKWLHVPNTETFFPVTLYELTSNHAVGMYY